MTKAEEKAIEAYPDNSTYGSKIVLMKQKCFIEGYHQAEKDLELTWEDISILREILDDAEQEFRKGLHEEKDYIGYCKEVLNRFNKQKEDGRVQNRT